MKRYSTGYDDGIWTFPAGSIEERESLREALCREAMEEIGIKIQEEKLIFLGIIHKLEEDNYENLAIYFKATQWSGNSENRGPHKCSELGWFDCDNLPENISTACAYFIQK